MNSSVGEVHVNAEKSRPFWEQPSQIQASTPSESGSDREESNDLDETISTQEIETQKDQHYSVKQSHFIGIFMHFTNCLNLLGIV